MPAVWLRESELFEMQETRTQLSRSIGKSRVCPSGVAGSRGSMDVIRAAVLAVSQQCCPLDRLPSQASFFARLPQQLWQYPSLNQSPWPGGWGAGLGQVPTPGAGNGVSPS